MSHEINTIRFDYHNRVKAWITILRGIVIAAAALTALAALPVGWLYWQARPDRNCPILAYLVPLSHAPISDQDHIALQSGGGLTRMEPVEITIYGDGQIVRDTTETFRPFPDKPPDVLGCPLHQENKLARIPASAARSLIKEARDRGFCRFCGQYARHVLDAGSTTITLTLAGVSHRVWVSGGDPPPAFDELYKMIYGLSGIEPFTDPRYFTPAREKECKEFSYRQYAIQNGISH